jgi:hypothetical protein
MTAGEGERKPMIGQEMHGASKSQETNFPQNEEIAAKDRLFEDLLRRAAAILSGQQPLVSQEG